MPVLSPTTETPESGALRAPPNEPAPVASLAAGLRGASRRMASDIEKWLANSTILEGSQIEIDVHESTAILRGRVASMNALREAEMIASSVRGVTEVDNRIRVLRS